MNCLSSRIPSSSTAACPHFLNESSTLICSGILDTRLSDVLDALTAAGLTVTATKAKDDWRCVTAIRKYI